MAKNPNFWKLSSEIKILSSVGIL